MTTSQYASSAQGPTLNGTIGISLLVFVGTRTILAATVQVVAVLLRHAQN